MGGLLTRTACGLYVMPVDVTLWPNFSWTQQVADMDGNQEDLDALALIAADLKAQVGTAAATGQFTAPIDVAFAALHDGDVERAEYDGLDFADPDYSSDVLDHDRRGVDGVRPGRENAAHSLLSGQRGRPGSGVPAGVGVVRQQARQPPTPRRCAPGRLRGAACRGVRGPLDSRRGSHAAQSPRGMGST